MPTPGERLNDALRDLIEVVRTADLAAADADTIEDHVAAVRAVTDGLRPHTVAGLRMQAALRYDEIGDDAGSRMVEVQDLSAEEYVAAGRPDPDEIFPYSPVVGRLNPVAPPVRIWRAIGDTGGEIHGEMTLGAPYNGPPGSVHGGVIAEVFDEMLGCVCVTHGLGGFTGTLTVVYRSPTPLDTPLALRAWHDRTEGRKIFAKGTIHHGDVLCAEAEGIFIRSDRLSPDGRGPAA